MASNKRLKRIRKPAIFVKTVVQYLKQASNIISSVCSVFESGVTGLRLPALQYLNQVSDISRYQALDTQNNLAYTGRVNEQGSLYRQAERK